MQKADKNVARRGDVRPRARRGRHGRRLPYWRFILGAAAVGALPALPALAQSATPALGAPAAAGASTDDPCEGLLAVLDRPTVADSPCSVKPGHAIAELGYQTAVVKGSDKSHLSFLPQAESRYGLPDGWELKLFPPNYLISTLRPSAGGGHMTGFGDTAFGVKKQLGTAGGFTFATDAKVTVPSGSRAFSDGGVEGNVQGIVGYSITPQLGVSALLGVSTLTTRGSDRRVERFTSFNPDLVATYQINDKLQLYSEVFGNTVTAPHKGANFTFDGGVQYLLTKSIEVDVEAGILLKGPPGQQARYLGFGAGFLF